MKLNIIKLFKVGALSLFITMGSCTEDEGNAPLENSTDQPGVVTNVTVQNLPGKARIQYTLPSNKDLLYVVARYTLENGAKMEVKSSYYNNSMLLEGFTGSVEKEVEITAVSRSEVESEVVTVKVTPLEAPIYDVFESIQVQPDFGGIRLLADNPNKEVLSLLIMQKNIQGDWEPLESSIYNTKVDQIVKSARGFDTIPQQFAFAVRDRWSNVTDTLFQSILPWYEALMPRTEMRPVTLPNDAELIASHTEVSDLFNGATFDWQDTYFTSRTVQTEDHLVTFDIGRVTKLSRLHIWNFSEPIGGQRMYYYLGAMKKFKIWGANELNDGDLSGWTLMGEFEVNKPSGLPYGQEDNDDLVAAEDGADYEIGLTKPAVRYLRIQCMENWAGGDYMAVSEVQVFGNPNF